MERLTPLYDSAFVMQLIGCSIEEAKIRLREKYGEQVLEQIKVISPYTIYNPVLFSPNTIIININQNNEVTQARIT